MTNDRSVLTTHNFEELVLSAIPDFNYLFDGEGRFAYTNRALADLLQTTPDEMVGKNFHDLNYPFELATRLQSQIAQVLMTGIRLVDETEFTNPSGKSGYYEYVFVPVRDDQGRVHMVAGSTRDITDRKLAQIALARSEENLRRAAGDLARSNQELEAFAYVSSHDLKEPLRKISNYADLLVISNKGKLTESSMQYLDRIASSAKRMNSLIESLLAFSRVGQKDIERETVDLNETLAQVVSDLEVQVQDAGAEITFDKLCTINADPVQIRQVLQNLISNALKFNSGAQTRIHVSSATDGKETKITVRDNGIGIDAQHRERIFEIFQRLHSADKYSGAGIGLAICKKIVEAHGGRIWVESEPGNGAAFHFTLKTGDHRN